jgi:AMP phosphorylase
LKLLAKVIDIEQGHNEVVLNSVQAQAMDFAVGDRLQLKANGFVAQAIVDQSATYLKPGEIGLFHEIAEVLQVEDGHAVEVEPTRRPASLDYVRKKLDGGVLTGHEISAIINDLMAQRLSSAELASFISSVYINGLSTDETASLTEAIIASGEVLKPPFEPAASEHSIGGVAGGRASMLIVPIMASLGVCMPKTASRAISSAAATADVMEVLAPVALDSKRIHAVLQEAGGCIVWGGAVNIAAADDKLIKIRNPLRLDPQPLLISSILAKKKAEGAKYVVFDIPTGRGAKVESLEKARELARAFEVFSARLGLRVSAVISDGSEPLMSYIGPTLEAREVIRTLASGGKEGSARLSDKACFACGVLLHLIRGVTQEEGNRIARFQLENGKAYEKFKQIIAAQGGNPDVKESDLAPGEHKAAFFAKSEGTVNHIDNKAISHVLRALGSPRDKRAGIAIKVSKGQRVMPGQELFELYSSTSESLKLGEEAARKTEVIELQRVVFEVV